MGIIMLLGGAALIGAAYAFSKVYFAKVGEKYGYDINGSKTRFLPMIGWIVVIVIEMSDNINVPLEIAAVLVTTLLYAGILYKKTNSIKDSILVALVNTVVSFVVAIFMFLKIIIGILSGNPVNFNNNNKNNKNY